MSHDGRAAVVAAIHDHVVATYPAWRVRAHDPTPTPSGPRYFPGEVAAFLGPALVAVGLHVFEDWYSGAQIFVTPEGRQITRERLRALLNEALAGHPDTVLRASIGSRAFWDHLAGRVPLFDGEEIKRDRPAPSGNASPDAKRSRDYRARKAADEDASARAFLVAVRPRIEGSEIDAPALYAAAVENISRKARDARDGFISPLVDPHGPEDGPEWAVPGKRRLYALADEILGVRVRRARGFVYVVRTIARALHERTLRALIAVAEILGRGPRTADEAERYADGAVEEIHSRVTSTTASDPRVEALPSGLVFAVAGADDADALRVFGDVGRLHLRRHPEARAEIVAVASALKAREDLIPAIRARAAAALDAEASA